MTPYADRNDSGPAAAVCRGIRSASVRRRVLHNLGYDVTECTGTSLDAFCRHRSLDTKTLLTVLEAIDSSDTDAAEKSPKLMTLSELCDRLECRHFHLAEILHGLHGDCPDALKQRFGAVRDRVLAHLREEEDTLFPLIRELDRAGAGSGALRAELGRRLHAMRHDHGTLEEALADLEEVDFVADVRTNAFLSDLAAALHGQIHDEDQVLYRRVAGMVRIPA